MSRFVGKTVCLTLLGIVVISSGCMQEASSKVVQLDPYDGGRPPSIRQLPPPKPRHRNIVSQAPTYRKPVPRISRSAGESGWIPSRGIANRWECIVVHHSASDRSTPESMRADHVNRRGWDALGYHFVIGNGVGYGNGQIHVGERWTKQMTGAHCKVPGNYYNEHGIGICLIGNFETHPPTAKQLTALARLSSFLSRECRIPRSRILTHGGITGKTKCPGRYFSLSPVLNEISGRSLSFASN